MKILNMKKRADKLTHNYIEGLKRLAKEQGYDQIRFFWISSDMPYVTIDLKEKSK